jgi:lipoyl(octanoyl) transferase
MRSCEVLEPGRLDYAAALALQKRLVAERKQCLIGDRLVLLEHPHTITLGRNARQNHVLASPDILARTGIGLFETDRGGDVTYHGPGQLVGYPILDLREWKRDVGAYVRAIEQVIIDTLADYRIEAGRIEGLTGVWTGGRKIAAIGVHISRWVTSHGFALNVHTDLDYFRYIVPCGLTRPVASMEQEGVSATLPQVSRTLAVHFGRILECEVRVPALASMESEN